jgi:cytidylate kinase
MYRIITIEREFGCGGGEIACELASRLGWKVWDQAVTEEIAKLAQVDPAAVQRCEERVDSRFHRLMKVFWRGSYERSMATTGPEIFDADCMVDMGRAIMQNIAEQGNAVIVGRGAPYFLKDRSDTFHVFLYATRAEKLHRLKASGRITGNAENMVDTIDSERIAFVKKYFQADWPTRALYNVMLNTGMGNDVVIATILDTMRHLERDPSFNLPKPTTGEIHVHPSPNPPA